MNAPPSTHFGKYEILGELGRGGFATVYRARDATLDREVALKVLAPHLLWEPSFSERFLQEARLAASLAHPAILTIYEVGEQESQMYMAAELWEGGSLRDLLQHAGPLPPPQALDILRQVARGLDFAHRRGLVHRDVKPGNILLRALPEGDAEGVQAVLADFGLVKALSHNTALTTTGALLGTAEYMAPEQIEPELADLGPHTDIYALGVVAYQMLTGVVPFAGTTTQVTHAHVHKPPQPPHQRRADLPAAASDAILQALAKNPQARFGTATAFIQALAAGFAPLPETVKPPPAKGAPAELLPPAAPTRDRQERRFTLPPLKLPRPRTLALLLLVLAVIGAAGWLAWGGWQRLFSPPMAAIYFTSTREGKRGIYRIDASGAVVLVLQSASTVEEWLPTLEAPRGALYFNSNRTGTSEIFTLEQGGSLLQVTQTPNGRSSTGPVHGPNGDLYFTSNRSGRYEVYHLSVQGETVAVTKTTPRGHSRNPALAPDGSLFFDSTREGPREIYRLDTAGVVHRITHSPTSAGSYEPAFSAAGVLYFTSDRSGKREIYRLAGGEAQAMTETKGQGESWSPVAASDGAIYFTSTRTGKREVFRLEAQGRITQITNTPGAGESFLGG
ncbi:MAG: serine/threonine-protein kinase [Caldilineales bacterium]|nr:serine/threonine-protein kinase [Caldilineales bacterium]